MSTRQSSPPATVGRRSSSASAGGGSAGVGDGGSTDDRASAPGDGDGAASSATPGERDAEGMPAAETVGSGGDPPAGGDMAGAPDAAVSRRSARLPGGAMALAAVGRPVSPSRRK